MVCEGTSASDEGGYKSMEALGATDRLGWKAMPFAREDLDSNCQHVRNCAKSYAGARQTLVSMPGEDCILAGR